MKTKDVYSDNDLFTKIKQFPITVVDNFFEDPDAVVKFANECKYERPWGRYPGVRSEQLHKLNFKLYNYITNFVIGNYFNEAKWTFDCNMQFQKIKPFHKDKEHWANKGFIHLDGSSVLAGLVYLNKNPDPDSGTSFFKVKEGKIHSFDYDTKFELCRGELHPDKAVEDLKELYDNHEKTIEVKNQYNRLIFYDGSNLHTQTNYWMPNDEERLTLVFFISKIEVNAKGPTERFKREF